MSIRFKHIALGGAIGCSHSIVVIISALYFGLGMSKPGTWFWQNILSQPGYSIAKYLESVGYSHSGYIFYALNILFYWFVSAILLHVIGQKKEKN